MTLEPRSAEASAWLDAWRTNLLENGVTLERTRELAETAYARVTSGTALSVEEALDEVAHEELSREVAELTDKERADLDELLSIMVNVATAIRAATGVLADTFREFVEAVRPILDLHERQLAAERRSKAARKGWETRRRETDGE